MWLFVAFLLVPLIEIALFIQIGGWLTLWPTLAIVIVTAVIGTWVVRQQGLRAMQDLRNSLEQLDDPMAPLAHGAMILFAGALLLTPGFLTDAIGFVLLLPAARVLLLRLVLQRITVSGSVHERRAGRASHDDIIEPEFHEMTDPPEPQRPDELPPGGKGTSRWRGH